MNDETKEDQTDRPAKAERLPYERPSLVSEPWLVNGATVVCNGTVSGGKKDSVGAPNFCRSNRLLS
jgi:hypothetical protein